MKNIFKKITEWYISQCDGDWEHAYGIKIETTANAGWLVICDLQFTNLQSSELPLTQSNNSKNDWYNIKIDKMKFIAGGDLNKLEFLLNEFIRLIEKGSYSS
jgi:hypothetical protein